MSLLGRSPRSAYVATFLWDPGTRVRRWVPNFLLILNFLTENGNYVAGVGMVGGGPGQRCYDRWTTEREYL